MDVVFLIAIFQAVFLAAFLVYHRWDLVANRILAAWLVAIALSLFVKYSYEVELIRQYPFLLGLDSGIPFLYGPLLWWYSCSLSGRKNRFERRDWFHLLPCLGQYAFMSINLLSLSEEAKVEFYEQMLLGYMPPSYLMANVIKSGQLLVYALVTIKLLSKSQHGLFTYFSDLHKVSLQWLITLSRIVVAIAIFQGVVVLAFGINQLISPALASTLLDFSLFLIVCVMVYYAWSRPELFELSKQQINPKYEGSTMSASQSLKKFDELQTMMKMDKPYLKKDLSLKGLSSLMGMSGKELSQVINENSQTNFFNYINAYRVDLFKIEILKEKNRRYKMMVIAEKCGFGSKSTFNTVFKKSEGCTPLEYLKNHAPSKSPGYDFRKSHQK